MSKELDKLITEFDQEFDQIPFNNSIYDEYNQLLFTVENDQLLREKMNRQKELQLIIMNLTRLRQKEFITIYKKELDEIDLFLDTNSKLLELNRLKYQIELEQDFIKNKINDWKENHGIKN